MTSTVVGPRTRPGRPVRPGSFRPRPGGPKKPGPFLGPRARKPIVLPAQPRVVVAEPPTGFRVASTTLLILAGVMIGFIAYLLVVSNLKHAHTQHLAYADFRKELALGTAPTGPTDPDDSTKQLALGSPVAVISIPKIGVNEVVFEGTTSSVLEKGPGHLRNSVLPGQAGTSVLFGRATTFGGPFGNINQLRKGDPITVTTGQGKQQFTVMGVRRAGDPIPPALAANKGRLTLDTADGPPLFAAGVLRVDAELTSTTQPTPTQIIRSADLSSAEPLLATDRSAWIPLVLWGQLLVIAAIALSYASVRWGRKQALVVAVPVIGFVFFQVAGAASRLLPNLT